MFLLMGILHARCNKCATDPILLYAGNEVLSYGIFKPGTIWIYQNDSTAQLDTVVVTAYEYRIDTTYENCKGSDVVANYREVHLSYSISSAFDTEYVASVTVGPYLFVAKKGGLPDTLFSTASCVDTGYCSVMDTFRVFRKKYPDVYERIDSASALYEERLTRFYSSPGYGLIRREILLADSTWETWSLIHSDIVQ